MSSSRRHAWSDEYRSGARVMSTRMADDYTPPSASLNPEPSAVSENAAIVRVAAEIAAVSAISLAEAVAAIRAGMGRDERIHQAGREDAAKAIEVMDHADQVVALSSNSWWSGYNTAKAQAAAIARGGA